MGDRLIVQADKVAGAVGLIEKPDNVVERSHSGTIVAISADLPLERRRGLVVGDHIVWSPHGGAELSGGGIDALVILDIEEVWGALADADWAARRGATLLGEEDPISTPSPLRVEDCD